MSALVWHYNFNMGAVTESRCTVKDTDRESGLTKNIQQIQNAKLRANIIAT